MKLNYFDRQQDKWQMNLAIFVRSFDYLDSTKNIDCFYSVVSLATWIYQELRLSKYTDNKLTETLKNYDMCLAGSIIDLCKDKMILSKMLKREVRFINNVYEQSRPRPYEDAKMLLDHGADVQMRNNVLVKDACIRNNTELVKLLLEYGIDTSVNDFELIKYSHKHCSNYNIINMLLLNAIDHKDVLYYAVHYHGSAETIKKILAVRDWKNYVYYDYSIDETTRYNDLVESIASDKNNVDILKAFVEDGADIHYGNDRLFRTATSHNLHKNVEYILSLGGIDIELIDRELERLDHKMTLYGDLIDVLTKYRNEIQK